MLLLFQSYFTYIKSDGLQVAKMTQD